MADVVENKRPKEVLVQPNVLGRHEGVPFVEDHTRAAVIVTVEPRIIHYPCCARKDGEHEGNEWSLRPHDVDIVLHIHKVVICDEKRVLVYSGYEEVQTFEVRIDL